MAWNTPEKQIKKYNEIIDFIKLYKKQSKHPMKKYFKKLENFGLSTFEIMYTFCCFKEVDISLMTQIDYRSARTNNMVRESINCNFDLGYSRFSRLSKRISLTSLIDVLNKQISIIENEVLVRYVIDKAQEQIVKVIYFRRKEFPQIQSVYDEEPWAILIDSISGYPFSNDCDFYATESLQKNTQQKDA